MGALARWFGAKEKTAEGAYSPGPYFLSDGWLSATAGRLMNWWQAGYSLNPYGEASAMVEACVSAYAQTVAMCPGGHWRKLGNGGRELVTTSAMSRILKRPNDYQSISDLLMNLTRQLYLTGNAYAYAVRNNRGEIMELHLMRTGQPMVAFDGSVFYALGGNEIAEQRFPFAVPVPTRDVLHVRLHTPRHPLKGESPILSTCLDRMMAGAALNQQISFYLNQARPSFMLETDEKLTAEQTSELRRLWNLQTQGENAGGTPILTWGLKAKPVATTAHDAQLAEMLKMADQNVALAFRMPLQVLGVGGAPFASTELLMQSWIASGLGFALNHIEEAFGNLFGLRGMPDEYLELDTSVLLRSAFKERIEGWVAGVKGGLFARNEGRADFDFPAVAGGDEPWVQQQDVPLSVAADLAKNPPKPEIPAPPAEPIKMLDARSKAAETALLEKRIRELWMLDLDDIAGVIATAIKEATAPLHARIANLEARELALPEKGDQGEPGQVGEPGRDGKDGEPGRDGKDGEPGKDGIDGKDGAPGADGRDGRDGHDPEINVTQDGATVEFAFQVGETRYVSEVELPQGPAGIDGKDGAPGADGRDGEPGPMGVLPSVKVWERGVHYAGEVKSHSGGTWQAVRDTAEEPPHDDWVCLAAPGMNGRDGQSLNPRRLWAADEEYRRLDVVALNGSSFVALKDDPGLCPGEGWMLMTAPGKRGERGEKGERGDRGPAGRDGPAVIAASFDDDGMLTLYNADGTQVQCDLYPVLSRITFKGR